MIPNDNIICNNYGESPKSKKKFLAAVPMWMWRVETHSFKNGLNFFQKAILKLKACPAFKAEDIASDLNLDRRLVDLILGELGAKKYLDKAGRLTGEGRAKLADADGLVVDETRRELGYVFKFARSGESYRYFVNRLKPADIQSYSNSGYLSLITKDRGEEKDRTEKVFCLKELEGLAQRPEPPEVRDILESIRNTSRKTRRIDDIETEFRDERQLGIRLLDENPEFRRVVTWFYLPEEESEEGDYFKADWQIQDPFGNGTLNSFLKADLETHDYQEINKLIREHFGDAPTKEKATLTELAAILQEYDKRELREYPLLDRAGTDLKNYIQTLVRAYVRFKNRTTGLKDAAQFMFIESYKVFEYVMNSDQKIASSTYERAWQKCRWPKKELSEIYRKFIYPGRDGFVPNGLWSDVLWLEKRREENREIGGFRDKSFGSSLVALLLTYLDEPKRPFLNLFKGDGRLQEILAIKDLRNHLSHAENERKKAVPPPKLTEERFISSYEFMKDFINQYLDLVQKTGYGQGKPADTRKEEALNV